MCYFFARTILWFTCEILLQIGFFAFASSLCSSKYFRFQLVALYIHVQIWRLLKPKNKIVVANFFLSWSLFGWVHKPISECVSNSVDRFHRLHFGMFTNFGHTNNIICGNALNKTKERLAFVPFRIVRKKKKKSSFRIELREKTDNSVYAEIKAIAFYFFLFWIIWVSL